jgi:hypothetical protein
LNPDSEKNCEHMQWYKMNRESCRLPEKRIQVQLFSIDYNDNPPTNNVSCHNNNNRN